MSHKYKKTKTLSHADFVCSGKVRVGMKYFSVFTLLLAGFPAAAYAAPDDIQGFGNALINFLGGTIVTFFFALALLVFIYNVMRYFILDNEAYSAREKAKRYMLWSIAGFILMVSIYGVVNLFVNGLSISRDMPVCPDSVPRSECSTWRR